MTTTMTNKKVPAATLILFKNQAVSLPLIDKWFVKMPKLFVIYRIRNRVSSLASNRMISTWKRKRKPKQTN